MGAQIGKGDWVECVDASPWKGGVPSGLASGHLYQIERVWPAGSIDPRDGLAWELDGVDLVGVVAPGGPLSNYLISRFRLVLRPDPKFIEALKTAPVEPERVLEVSQAPDGRGRLAYVTRDLDGVIVGFEPKFFPTPDDAFAALKARAEFQMNRGM